MGTRQYLSVCTAESFVCQLVLIRVVSSSPWSVFSNLPATRPRPETTGADFTLVLIGARHPHAQTPLAGYQISAPYWREFWNPYKLLLSSFLAQDTQTRARAHTRTHTHAHFI